MALRPVVKVMQHWSEKFRLASGVASYGARAHAPLSKNNFIFSLLWSRPKSESHLSKYCVVCEISWCRCQQLAALLIVTALVTIVIEQMLQAEGRRECLMT